MKNKIQNYLKYFKVIKKADGREITVLKDEAPKELKDALYKAHEGHYPNDFIYDMFFEILYRLANDFDVETVEDVENVRYEVIDDLVDIYTSDLTKWLSSNDYNVYYLSEVLREYQPKDGFQALQMAQAKAIDDVFDYVYDLLNN